MQIIQLLLTQLSLCWDLCPLCCC